jgi:hypothetical protein
VQGKHNDKPPTVVSTKHRPQKEEKAYLSKENLRKLSKEKQNQS